MLNTYGSLKIENGESGKGKDIDIARIPEKQLIDMLRQLIVATRSSAKDAVFSLPVFSTFITLIDLPFMSDKELASSIPFEAKKYIPVPLEEVQFNWSIIEKISGPYGDGQPQNSAPLSPPTQIQALGGKIQVLFVAVPNDLIARYKNIAKSVGLKGTFEIETFSLVRALSLKGDSGKGVSVVVDMGFKSTEICLIDNGLLRLSHNFEVSGESITKAIQAVLNLDYGGAEDFKLKKGLKAPASEKSAVDAILSLINTIVFEMEKTIMNYQQMTGRKAQKIILSGGTANMPGLVDYLSNYLGIAVTVANPFSEISHSPALSQNLREVGPSFSVAIGLAKKNLV